MIASARTTQDDVMAMDETAESTGIGMGNGAYSLWMTKTGAIEQI